MTSEQLKAIEKMAEVLSRKLQVTPVSVVLQAPAQLTIKRRNGDYRRQSFIGGSRFIIQSAYAGKRGGVILVGIPGEPLADVRAIEVPLDDMAEHFGPVSSKELNDILTGAKERIEAELQQAAELEVAAEKARFADPAFSSW